ncbi:hypothetical protein [Streptomyces sp. NPDC006645]|uniref:hypothetical protein n=1 Tax=unclassified Streptomyces TaxID=2593676 RepID=UPI0033B017DF
MSDQPTAARQQLEPAADGLRAYAAQTRESADRLAAVLEGIAANGLPSVEDCTPAPRAPGGAGCRRMAELIGPRAQKQLLEAHTVRAASQGHPGRDERRQALVELGEAAA